MAIQRRTWTGTIAIVLFITALLQTPATGFAQTDRGTYVTTASVRLRQGPGTQYDVVATIPRGIRVHVVGKDGAWLKIESKHGNKPGYIHGQYARPAKTPQIVRATNSAAVAGTYRTLVDVDLREGAGLKHRIIYKIPAGTHINVVRSEGDWLRVESKRGNRPGYVEKRSVERVGE